MPETIERDASNTIEEAIKALSGRIQTLEQTQALTTDLEALGASWERFQAMLERNNLSDLLTFTVHNGKAVFELHTPYRGNKGFEQGEHAYLAFMKIDLEESLDVSYINSALIKLILNYTQAQQVINSSGSNKLDMLTESFQEIITQLNKEFKKYDSKLTKEKLVELLLVIFFQEVYILQPIPVNKTVELVCGFKDFSNLATALNRSYVAANKGEPLTEKFAKEVKNLPKEWVFELMNYHPYDF